ncbi:MAG: prenyltransferase/squalene oxidase repeat-containing protein [Planctomycetota bacterium]|jgi:hypothetical protein
MAIMDRESRRDQKALSERLGDAMPAWIVSLVVHAVVVLLLGLKLISARDGTPAITLATSASGEDLPGGFAELDDAPDAVELDDPFGAAPDLPPAAASLDSTPVSLEGLPSMVPLSPGPSALALDREAGPHLAPSGGMFHGRDPRIRAQILREQGGTTRTEVAVARGLVWLARHQNTDGSWSLHAFHQAPRADGSCSGRGRKSDAAGTALGLLPFLGAGHTHLDGQYAYVVAKGLQWLVQRQGDDGDLRDHDGFGRMYAHGQAAIVLCEAYAMTGDPDLRVPAQKALDFIVLAQHGQGGWRYRPGQAGDTSVFGWQMMALQSGRVHYLHVPERTLKLASGFLNQVGVDEVGGKYAYQPGNSGDWVMTAEALLCRLYLGWPRDHPGIEAGVQYLLRHLPDRRRPNVYYWYYATQVMHHVGAKPWETWNAKMRSVLVDTQETQRHAAGSWAPRGEFANRGGRLYMTSLAVCTLEVYYRHMPLNREEAVVSGDSVADSASGNY